MGIFINSLKKLLHKKSSQTQVQPEDIYNDNQISKQNLIETTKSVIDPIKGYTLCYHYEDVEITSWDYIPNDIEIGNRIVFIQEPENPVDDKAVRLMFVPQRRKFGYLYRGKLQDMANDYINRGDKVVARLSFLQFKPYKLVKINIAFFKKIK